MSISVNGTFIDEEVIAREMQYHPGADRDEVARQAATALVVRELLRQRAAELAIDADGDEAFDLLIAREVAIPEPTAEEVARFHKRNWYRLRSRPVYEASHIFFPAHPDDEAARADAREKAEAALAKVRQDPGCFAELARACSACSSAAQGGALGQISRGDTNAEVERALATMDEGATEFVPSRHGYHVLRLHRRDNGRELPAEEATSWIADYLKESARRRAISQYIQLLAAGARIKGIELALPDSPLVQ
jgi:peptidyl-prolyl cis-trans isomerase C